MYHTFYCPAEAGHGHYYVPSLGLRGGPGSNRGGGQGGDLLC